MQSVRGYFRTWFISWSSGAFRDAKSSFVSSLVLFTAITSSVLCTATCPVIAEEPNPAIAKEKSPEPVAAFEHGLRPFLVSYCVECHDSDDPDGGLTLSTFKTHDDASRDWALWAKVNQRLRKHEMPPEGSEQPSAEEFQSATRWIEGALKSVDCESVKDPGRVTIRRLNRAEYQNTIRDLLGVTFDTTEVLPVDDSGYGFDNIGDVLSMSPLLMEKYMDAAQTISHQAIHTPESINEPIASYPPRKLRGGNLNRNTRALYEAKTITTQHRFPSPGRYLIRARAFADQAGPEKARIGFSVDGRSICEAEVAAEEGEAETLTAVLHVEAGRRRVAISFLNDYYDAEAEKPGDRDRNLFIEEIEIVGPIDHQLKDAPAAHQQIIGAAPETDEWLDAARKIVSQFASRAYRRPLTESESDRITRLAQKVHADGGSFERAIQTTIHAVLVSPNFLYRGEIDPAPHNDNAIRRINQWELASRLSYFLWSSMPDDALRRQADNGTLQENLPAEIRRMLSDKRSGALCESFAGQWLETRRLDGVTPDPKRFPEFDAALREAMRGETEHFFTSLVREDRSVLDLLQADYTFLNERLAKHYGIKKVKGPEFRRVKLGPESRRGGILTHASFLTITSDPTRTSPVKRGKWILDQLLNDPPPPPPPGAGELPSAEEADASLSLREQMDLHRRDPTCFSCHNKMDPLGFSLENFDAVGRWRTGDTSGPIDAKATLPDGRTFVGAAGLQKALMQQPDTFRRTIAEKMLTYALGRGLEYYDRCAVDRIVDQMKKHDDRSSVLIQSIVESYPFQYRRGDGGQP